MDLSRGSQTLYVFYRSTDISRTLSRSTLSHLLSVPPAPAAAELSPGLSTEYVTCLQLVYHRIRFLANEIWVVLLLRLRLDFFGIHSLSLHCPTAQSRRMTCTTISSLECSYSLVRVLPVFLPSILSYSALSRVLALRSTVTGSDICTRSRICLSRHALLGSPCVVIGTLCAVARWRCVPRPSDAGRCG